MQRSAREGRSPSDGARRGPLAPFSRGRCQVAVVVGGLPFCRGSQVIREKKKLLPESPRALASGSSVEARTLTGFAVGEATNRHAEHGAAGRMKGRESNRARLAAAGLGPLWFGLFLLAALQGLLMLSRWLSKGVPGGTGVARSNGVRGDRGAAMQGPRRLQAPRALCACRGRPRSRRSVSAAELRGAVARAAARSQPPWRSAWCSVALSAGSTVALFAAMAVKRRARAPRRRGTPSARATGRVAPPGEDPQPTAARRPRRRRNRRKPSAPSTPRAWRVWARSGGGHASPAVSAVKLLTHRAGDFAAGFRFKRAAGAV